MISKACRCGGIRTNGICNRCGTPRQGERPTAQKRGYTYSWQKARLAFLRQHPLCVHCQQEGIIKPANVVDHIQPHRGNQDLFWDVNNWQSLCTHHHNVKTNQEQ